MPHNSALSAQQVATRLPKTSASAGQRFMQAVTSRKGVRFAKIAGISFAATFPVLGIVDPAVMLASGLADVATVEAAITRAHTALSHMAVVELVATGGAAVLALGALAGLRHLRNRYLLPRQE